MPPTRRSSDLSCPRCHPDLLESSPLSSSVCAVTLASKAAFCNKNLAPSLTVAGSSGTTFWEASVDPCHGELTSPPGSNAKTATKLFRFFLGANVPLRLVNVIINNHEEEGSSESSSEEESGDDEEAPTHEAKLYNPADYDHLNEKVTPEIQGLFDYIQRHKPADIELDTKLKPFIPDFIPAVGDIDSFLKIPPPDGKEDGLGLTVLDEPASQQSDPTVLDLQLRIISKQSGLKPVTVHSIENADKNPMKITTWINNIEDVHRKKPPPTVNYSKNMPDIEALMQVWPPEFEELLKTCPLPSADLDMDLAQFTRVVCAILDIPVYDKMTESLHVLFTLYSEFKNNAHFQQ